MKLNNHLKGEYAAATLFTNPMKGTSPMGYQAGIAGSNVQEIHHNPMWRIDAAVWKEASRAKFLTTASYIRMTVSGAKLSAEIAGFVANCPIVDLGGA
jgi:hypothetical protein